MKVYLDNAATTYPKPQEVYSAVLNHLTNVGSNPGRGSSSSSLESNKIVFKCRNAIMNFFNFNKPENVIFTSNITSSLNILIKGLVKDGWHVITSSMDHNATLRPLDSLRRSGKIQLDILQCTKSGVIDIDDFVNTIQDNTKLGSTIICV